MKEHVDSYLNSVLLITSLHFAYDAFKWTFDEEGSIIVAEDCVGTGEFKEIQDILKDKKVKLNGEPGFIDLPKSLFACIMKFSDSKFQSVKKKKECVFGNDCICSQCSFGWLELYNGWMYISCTCKVCKEYLSKSKKGKFYLSKM